MIDEPSIKLCIYIHPVEEKYNSLPKRIQQKDVDIKSSASQDPKSISSCLNTFLLAFPAINRLK